MLRVSIFIIFTPFSFPFLSFAVCLRGINTQEPCGAPAAPEERGRGPRPADGSETRRTGAGRARDGGELKTVLLRTSRKLNLTLICTDDDLSEKIYGGEYWKLQEIDEVLLGIQTEIKTQSDGSVLGS